MCTSCSKCINVRGDIIIIIVVVMLMNCELLPGRRVVRDYKNILLTGDVFGRKAKGKTRSVAVVVAVVAVLVVVLSSSLSFMDGKRRAKTSSLTTLPSST